jgi:hypothetical protein
MIISSRKIETLMHIIKGNIGAGILAFPYALSKAGLLVSTHSFYFPSHSPSFQFGPIAFWIMGIMTLYCMHQLLRCHAYYRYKLVTKNSRNFSINKNLLFSTSRDKCDFGDIMRYTLATCRWRIVHRYAKLGK